MSWGFGEKVAAQTRDMLYPMVWIGWAVTKENKPFEPKPHLGTLTQNICITHNHSHIPIFPHGPSQRPYVLLAMCGIDLVRLIPPFCLWYYLSLAVFGYSFNANKYIILWHFPNLKKGHWYCHLHMSIICTYIQPHIYIHTYLYIYIYISMSVLNFAAQYQYVLS